MKCPFCNSENVDVPMVDIGVGEQQCGPAGCYDCHASQDQNGVWRKPPKEPCKCGCGKIVPLGAPEFAHPEDYREEQG